MKVVVLVDCNFGIRHFLIPIRLFVRKNLWLYLNQGLDLGFCHRMNISWGISELWNIYSLGDDGYYVRETMSDDKMYLQCEKKRDSRFAKMRYKRKSKRTIMKAE